MPAIGSKKVGKGACLPLYLCHFVSFWEQRALIVGGFEAKFFPILTGYTTSVAQQSRIGLFRSQKDSLGTIRVQ